jgi:hypothetical protein
MIFSVVVPEQRKQGRSFIITKPDFEYYTEKEIEKEENKDMVKSN